MLLLHVENTESPYRGRGDTPFHTLPPLGREAPSDDGASHHRILDYYFLFSQVGTLPYWY